MLNLTAALVGTVTLGDGDGDIALSSIYLTTLSCVVVLGFVDALGLTIILSPPMNNDVLFDMGLSTAGLYTGVLAAAVGFLYTDVLTDETPTDGSDTMLGGTTPCFGMFLMIKDI